MKIYNSTEYKALHIDQREENGKAFDRMPATKRRECALAAIDKLVESVPAGYEFKCKVVANMLGTEFLFSNWIASDIIHAASIRGLSKSGWQRFSTFTT